MQAKYKRKKEDIFPSRFRALEEKRPEIDYFEKSAEIGAEETMMMLKRIASTGYMHKDELGHFQSKEFDFVGTQKEEAQGNDKRGTSQTLHETQEETRQT